MLEEVEAILRNDAAIFDCAVLGRESTSGRLEWVAYVVPQAPLQIARLHSAVAEQLGPDTPPLVVVEIPALPLTAEGLPDAAALRTIPVLDDDLVSQAERRVAAHPGVRHAAGVVHCAARVHPPLHLSELLPGWSRGAAAGLAGVAGQLAPAAPAATGPMAISDGGELRQPAGAPSVVAQMLLAAARVEPPSGIACIDADGIERFCSYAELTRSAQRVLGGLQRAGLARGDFVILHFRDNRDFFEAFWACILGGLVPVPTPIAPTYAELNGNVRRLGDAYALLGGAVIASSAALLPELRDAMRLLDIGAARLLSIESLRSAPAAAVDEAVRPDDVALMMLTSGSTGKPKGVPLSHRNLVSRSFASCERNRLDDTTVSVNWMPLDHVGGLILLHLRDLYVACRQIHVATELVIRDPLYWLDLLSRYRATSTFAPNFAFGLVCGLTDEIARRSWDLSSLRCIVNGGEAIVAASARKFMRLLAPHGLPGEAMVPAWGMSETSSGVTYSHAFRLDTVADSDTYVPVGPPIAGVELRIVDEAGRLMREGQVGQLQVRGATLFAGYYGNRPPREEAFTADGWFRTGDLARLDAGVLSITGREKDVIIINGANFSGPAIENAIEELGTVVRSFTAACGVADPRADGGEGLAVFFVPADDSDAALADTLRGLRQRMVHDFGFSPAFMLPLTRAEIPKTSLGKIQRGALKTALAAGQFEAALKRVDVLTANDNTLPPWFFRRRWQRRPLPAGAASADISPVLIVSDGSALAGVLRQRLGGRSKAVVQVDAGHRFERIADDHFVVDADAPQCLAAAIQALPAAASPTLNVVYLCSVGAGVDASGGDDSRRAAQACGRLAAVVGGLQRRPEAVTLAVVSCGADNVTGSEPVDAVRAAVAGMVQSISRESAAIRALHIDVGDANPEAAAGAVVQELQGGGGATEIAYRAGLRWVPVLHGFVPWPAAGRTPLLRRGGRYLISGGLGGVGAALATYLLREFDAQVLLVARPATTRPDAVDDAVDDAVEAQRQMAFARLREISPRVDWVRADVADHDALRAAVGPVLAAWDGPLDAVFHLAAVVHEKALADETQAGFESQFRPKIGGAQALLRLLRDHDGAALVAFSSIVGVFGGAQLGAYAAASRYLDALASAPGSPRVYSLDWSAWRDTGLNRQYGAAQALRAMGGVELAPAQALTSLRVALNELPGQIVIGLDGQSPVVARHAAELTLDARVQVFFDADASSAPDLTDEAALCDRFGVRTEVVATRLAVLPADERGDPDRLALARIAANKSEFLAPASATELHLSELWRRILGVDSIGTDASFFELGGQSLMATQLLSAIEQRFGMRWTLRDVFAAPTLSEQAARIDADRARPVAPGAPPAAAISHGAAADPVAAAAPDAARGARPAIKVSDSGRAMPIGSGQQRLWFLDRMDPHNAAYNIVATIGFRHGPATESVQRCLQALVDRHESLRTHFPLVEGQPCQWIANHLAIELASAAPGSPDELAALEQAQARVTFDLACGPLLRACLFSLPDGSARLQLTLHHSIADGWSMKVFFREFLSLFTGTAAAALPPLTLQYVDFAEWQHQRALSGALEPQVAYWRRQLEGNLTGLVLEGDFTRPAVQTHRGVRLIRPLPTSLARRVRTLARQRSVTPFVALLAGLEALLACYAQQDDIVVGTVVANRNRSEFESLIGFVVNMLTLRTNLGGDPRFVDILQRVQSVLLDAHANQDVPFETLVDLLQPPRDPDRAPLFQIACDLRDPEITRSEVAGVTLGVMGPDLGACQYDLHLTLEEHGEGLTALWQFNADLFATPTIERMAENYETLLDAVADRPELRLSELPLPSPGERALLEQWNRTERDYPREACVHELFEVRARETPQAIAVEYGDERLSYAELNARANRLAHHLRSLGVGPEVMVGLSLERSAALVVAMLGILKAGGAYVPLDPEYPAERLAFMLGDTAAPVVVTQGSLLDKLPQGGARFVVLDRDRAAIEALPAHDAPSGATAHSLAYVIYTSGSTGTPKGVQVTHRSINRLVCNADYVQFVADDRVAQVSVVSFDAATFEVWGALLNGACLVIVAREVTLVPQALARFLREQRISVIFLTAVLFDRVAREAPQAFGSMRYMSYGGAAASIDALRAVLGSGAPPRQLVNGYGPTEVTTFALTHRVEAVAAGASMVPIGRPIANTTAHVLGRFGERVPIGVTGELYLGGDGVARGYLDRPELDAERFLPDHFSGHAGARLYRTGDMVRQQPNGEIEFLGRTDQQIKLRGFRIELGEIEAALCAIDAVQEAAVVVRPQPDGDPSLVAYVTPVTAGAVLQVEALRQRLQSCLPPYMVPASIVVLAQMPLSPNGKIDRAALPAPHTAAPAPRASDLPRGEVERVIAEAWQQVLNRPQLDRRMNFFDAGGHSLKVAQLHALLSTRFEATLSLVDLFRYPTIEMLAAHLAAATLKSGARASRSDLVGGMQQ